MNSKHLKKKRPIAITIGTNDDGIIARADNEAVKACAVQLLDFVRIDRTVGRIVRILDAHDFSRDNEISRIAKECLSNRKTPDSQVEQMIFKKLVIEPMGAVTPKGELAEATGGLGYFQPVYRAAENDIAMLYPLADTEGVTVGKIASGYKVSGVDFQLGISAALSRHLAVFGKNGTGKTNFLKEIIASNLELPAPLPMLVFGHPDIGTDNPNDRGTVGLAALKNANIEMVGYRESLKLAPEEITLSDIFEQFSCSIPQKDLWAHMQSREPRHHIDILANYDITADPYKLKRETVKDKATHSMMTTGIAIVPTIDAVSRQARILAEHVDANAPRIISRILADLKQGKVVLANTFDMSDYYQGMFVRLLLNRLQRAGKGAMHKGIAQRILVVIDEAQHFIQCAGERISGFCRECRKFGITLCLLTQSPKSIPESVYGQIYSTIAFHLNRSDIRALVEAAPMLSECSSMISRPPLKNTLGTAIVQAVGYPYPAVVRVPRFERRFEKGGEPK